MRILLLHGLNCDGSIWNPMLCAWNAYEIINCSYPHTLTMQVTMPSEIAKWVYNTYKDQHIDVIIGHSMGGIVAINLLATYSFPCDKLICIESNLRPANPFYRNLLTDAHMKLYGENVKQYLAEQSNYFSKGLMDSVQHDFDYTMELKKIAIPVYGIYGDRGKKEYNKRYNDLCLDRKTLEHITFKFVEDACHLPMLENPKGLTNILQQILKE